MNRLVKLFACALFASAIVGGSSQAFAMNVTGISQAMIVGTKTVTASDEMGDKIKFVSDGKVLRLMSADGTKDFLSFNSFDGIYSGVDYSVRAIETADPTMRLFEISATREGKSCGYWLVGNHIGGAWTTYVSWNSFANLGFRTDRWHDLKATIENQQLVITSYNGYGKMDWRAQVFWNEQDGWFGLKRF
jgi:hypothetical protein